MATQSNLAKVGTGLAALGMVTLCTGLRGPALTLFGLGFRALERDWRARHPEFRGGLRERWESALRFYRSSHENRVNRALHIVGIPLIAAGAVGLLAGRAVATPRWTASFGSFALGWGLNIIGHALFERRAPAFSDDPLSFVAGPVWDLQQISGHFRGDAHGSV
jgi:hypothetical protein